jgi:dTDP-4-dehydrorhamnose reductase
MKILLTGINGQVGHAMLAKLAGHDVLALAREQLDLTNPEAIIQSIQLFKPDLIINPAAYTAVDKAESEPELAHAINTIAPQILAQEAAKIGAGIIHFSTDYVYDGSKQTPYVETDQTNPVSVYGKSKLAGEDAIRASGAAHLVLRTSWVYGAYGKNFLNTMLRLAGERDVLRVVADQFGAPTSAQSIADGVVQLINVWNMQDKNQSGTYHFTNVGEVSWHGFTQKIVNQYNQLQAKNGLPVLKTAVENIATITAADYPTPAARPANSRLNNAKLKQVFGVELPTWQDGLQRVLENLPPK